MTTFIFTKHGKKKLQKLPKYIQNRIILKLTELKAHTDILSVLKNMYDFEPATHRLRIGRYRLVLELAHQDKDDFEFLILDVGHRKDIYR